MMNIYTLWSSEKILESTNFVVFGEHMPHNKKYAIFIIVGGE